MNYTYDKENKELNVFLQDEIDNISCKKMRAIIDGYIIKYQPRLCILDFANVSFIDSSAIGLVLGRYNLLNMLGAKVEVRNLNYVFLKIFKMANIDKYICIEEGI